MLYQKGNKKINIETAVLFREDGSIVTNATPEMWEAEGWSKYVAPKPVKEEAPKEPSFSEKQEDLLHEAESYYRDRENLLEINDTRYSLEELDLDRFEEYASVMKSGETVDFGSVLRGDVVSNFSGNVTGAWILDLIEKIKRYRFECFKAFSKHSKVIVKSLTADDELKVYDYTTGYPRILEFTVD